MRNPGKVGDLFERPFGLVLSGGGARGMFHVGVWKILVDHGARLDAISGTSAGAINGALIAAGRTPAQMVEFWLSLARTPPVAVNVPFFDGVADEVSLLLRKHLCGVLWWSARNMDALSSSGGFAARAAAHLLTRRFDLVSKLLEGVDPNYMFCTDALRARLKKEMGGDIPLTSDGGKVRLAINAMDIQSGGVVRFVNHDPLWPGKDSTYVKTPIGVDEVVSSASIPLLFNTVSSTADTAALWDGGLLVNTPIAPVVTLGSTRVVPVLVTTGPAGHLRRAAARPARPLTLGGSVERLADAFLENAYNTDRKLLLARNQLADRPHPTAATSKERERHIVLMKAIRPRPSGVFDAGSYLYFDEAKLMKMYEAGEEAARKWIAAGPLVDHP